MNEDQFFQKRISYQGDLKRLLEKVCSDFDLGKYHSHAIIPIGYEDFNIRLDTNKGKYLVKALSDERNNNDRKRYAEIIDMIAKSKIAHPKLYQSNDNYLHAISLDGVKIFVFVMQYIDGKTPYDLGTKPTKNELRNLTKQIALINKIDFKPSYFYDCWSVVNLEQEYKKNKKYLNKSDQALVKPIQKTFSDIKLKRLPHCLVHGDVLDNNIIIDKQGKFWIIDFSVANYYPRIHELAVFLSGPAYDVNNQQQFMENYHLVIKEYKKHIKLEEIELDTLPIYLKAAHAICIVGAINVIRKNGDSKENQYWLNTARKGLELTSKIYTS